MNMVIIGCGGVGSNLAYILARAHPESALTLVDFDKVEAKNLQRQFFKEADIGRNKAEALKDHLLEMNKNLNVNAMDVTINAMSLALFDKADFAFLTTDNNLSKKLCGQHFTDFILVNCEADIVEIKTELDKEEMKAWQISTGYNSTQTFESNLIAATLAFMAYQWNWKGVHNIQLSDLNTAIQSLEGKVKRNVVGSSTA